VTPSPTTRTWILTGSLENFRVNTERGEDDFDAATVAA
jgi:hypothetical protein